jgi:hypothetical protein
MSDTELTPVDHDPFAEATQHLDTRYHNMAANEQPHEETSYENIFGATLPVSRTNPGFQHDFENENLNAGREINRGAVLNAHQQMERVRNEPGYTIPETGMRVEPDRNFVPPSRLSAEQEGARAKRGQEFVGNMILGASPLGPALAAKSAYEAGSDVPGALRRGDYAGAAGSAGLAALGVAGALPAASAFRDMANQTHIFAGPGAATANLSKLNFAKFSERLGTHPETIWNETGWARGADGKWRFEIPDNEAYLRHALSLGDNTLFSGLEHPELKAAYGEPPHVWGQYGPRHDQARGSYTPAQPGEQPHIAAEAPSAGEAATTALHEYQHHLQHNEGFTPGGNPSMFTPEQLAGERARLNRHSNLEGNGWGSASGYHGDMTDEDIGASLYHRLAGEVEARNTQHRATWTPEERRAAPPWTTEDVPRREQIVFSDRNEPSGAQASEPGFRGTLPEGHELERYSMALTDAEPFLFRGVESSHGLDRAATALEAGNPELARKALGFATQDLAVAAKKLGVGEGREATRPVELALQDAMRAEGKLRSAYQAGDAASFRKAAQSFKGSLAEAVRARAEIMRGRLEPKAYQYWLDNHVPERTRSILSDNPPFAKGGEVLGGAPRDHPHARLIGSKWLVPDAKRPGHLMEAV